MARGQNFSRIKSKTTKKTKKNFKKKIKTKDRFDPLT